VGDSNRVQIPANGIGKSGFGAAVGLACGTKISKIKLDTVPAGLFNSRLTPASLDIPDLLQRVDRAGIVERVPV